MMKIKTYKEYLQKIRDIEKKEDTIKKERSDLER